VPAPVALTVPPTLTKHGAVFEGSIPKVTAPVLSVVTVIWEAFDHGVDVGKAEALVVALVVWKMTAPVALLETEAGEPGMSGAAPDIKGETALAAKISPNAATFVANFKNPALPLIWETYYRSILPSLGDLRMPASQSRRTFCGGEGQ
jgi:hypothetical protein